MIRRERGASECQRVDLCGMDCCNRLPAVRPLSPGCSGYILRTVLQVEVIEEVVFRCPFVDSRQFDRSVMEVYGSDPRGKQSRNSPP